MEEYLNPIPPEPIVLVENNTGIEQKTPKRIIIIYQTTGNFENISEENKTNTPENSSR